MSTDMKNKFKNLIESNNEVGLHDLLQRGDLSPFIDHKYFNPYTHAIKANHLNLISYLHRQGFHLQRDTSTAPHKKQKINADTNKSVPNLYPDTLIEAIKYENSNAVRLLIELKVCLNPPNYKNIPLQIAYNLCQKLKNDNQTRDRIMVG